MCHIDSVPVQQCCVENAMLYREHFARSFRGRSVKRNFKDLLTNTMLKLVKK